MKLKYHIFLLMCLSVYTVVVDRSNLIEQVSICLHAIAWHTFLCVLCVPYRQASLPALVASANVCLGHCLLFAPTRFLLERTCSRCAPIRPPITPTNVLTSYNGGAVKRERERESACVRVKLAVGEQGTGSVAEVRCPEEEQGGREALDNEYVIDGSRRLKAICD